MDEKKDNNEQDQKSELQKLLTNKKQVPSGFIDKITDKVYLGDIDGSKDFDYFKEEKISNVLSIINKPFEYNKEDKINHKIINIDDQDNVNIIKYFKECIDFIEKADKIYIHCMAGVSRSASIVIAYIMWKEHKNYNEAFAFVKKYRFIYPNFGFVYQLKYFGKLLIENKYDLDKIEKKKYIKLIKNPIKTKMQKIISIHDNK